MILKNYPCHRHIVDNILKRVCGEHTGILQSMVVNTMKYAEDIDRIASMTGRMPNYHKVIIDPSVEVQYHLTGYGTFHEEALIRLVGEAIERYSLMAGYFPHLHNCVFTSYRQIQKEGKVLPFEFLQALSDHDYERLNLNHSFQGIRRLTEDDVVGWIRCRSLFRKGEDIWYPLQMLFVGYRINTNQKEVRFTPAFSTGTASHVSLEKALLNAILEFIEIDSLMVFWYADHKADRIIMDDMSILENYPVIFGKNSKYDVVGADISALKSVRAKVMGTIIVNKEDRRPLIVLGAQGHLDPLRGFYRSLLESMAIMFLGIFGPIYAPKEYYREPDENDFTDLDTNVAYWSIPGNPASAQKKRDFIYSKLSGNTKPLSSMQSFDTGDTGADLVRLLTDLSAVSEYGAYIDVTPPETRDYGWYVMRAYFPELMTLCVPGVPSTNHPRFKQFGGIINELPHPLP